MPLPCIMDLHDWSSPIKTSRQLWSAYFTGLRIFTVLASVTAQGLYTAGGYLQEGDNGSQLSRPLHACWSALLQRMLKADQTALVLRALDTASASASSGSDHSVSALLLPHEAHQLVDTARSLTHAGE